jgi:hypothetical protein
MTKRSASRRANPSLQQNRNQLRTRLIWIAVGIGVIGLAFLLYLSLRGPTPIRDLVTFGRPPRGHDNTLSLEFTELPPVGGTHHDIWQNCGIYTEPVPAENVIHSMEHGAVWITYRPDLSTEDVAYLQDLVRGQRFLLLSPYPGLKSPVVLTAWGLQLEVDSARDGRVEEFIDRYQVGPQTPERGATCADGVGQPVS